MSKPIDNPPDDRLPPPEGPFSTLEYLALVALIVAVIVLVYLKIDSTIVYLVQQLKLLVGHR